MPIGINQNGVEVDGKTYPLFGGAFHYWRHDRALWPEILDRIIEMGFKFVETYVPWSVHELDEGKFDFGENDERKDVGAFLKLIGDKGLFALVRPGPHINSELTYFGYPERIFDKKELLSRTAEGTPAILPVPPRFFPVPSYASPEFYQEVAGWFDAVCPILCEHVHPNGPVVGVQSDNEMSLFFRTNPFDQDYSDAAVSLYHDFLRKKYGTVEAMAQLYSHRHARFQDVLPPREFAASHCREVPYYTDWQEFKEFLIYYGIRKIADMLRERGLTDVFYFHNFPSYPATPMHVPGLEQEAVDVAGVDLYSKVTDYELLSDTARFLSGSSRLPFIPEFGAGCWLWWRPLTLNDHKFANYAVLMNGVKAINHYMLVDRDRWYGAPVARDGRKRAGRFDFYCEINRFLAETNFHEYRMHADAALLHMRDYERLEALSSLAAPLPREALGTLPPEWFCPRTTLGGLRDPVAAIYRQQFRAYKRGFREAGYTLALADSDVPQDYLDRYRMIVAPSFEFMGRALQKKLLLYALMGGVLVLGPRAPLLDEYFRENSKFISHLVQPSAHAAEFNYNGMLLQRVDFFKGASHPFIEWDGKVIAYERPLEKGTIILMGFVFPDYAGAELAPHVAEVVRRIADRAGIVKKFPADDPFVETVLHTRGEDKLLFAANPTDRARTTSISLNSKQSLRDWHSGEVFDAGNCRVEMGAYSVRVFVVK